MYIRFNNSLFLQKCLSASQLLNFSNLFLLYVIQFFFLAKYNFYYALVFDLQHCFIILCIIPRLYFTFQQKAFNILSRFNISLNINIIWILLPILSLYSKKIMRWYNRKIWNSQSCIWILQRCRITFCYHFIF